MLAHSLLELRTNVKMRTIVQAPELVPLGDDQLDATVYRLPSHEDPHEAKRRERATLEHRERCRKIDLFQASGHTDPATRAPASPSRCTPSSVGDGEPHTYMVSCI
jgi:hypothetical protein